MGYRKINSKKIENNMIPLAKTMNAAIINKFA
jgi:hypothetical protein